MLGRYQRKKRSISRTNSKNQTKQQQVKDNTQPTEEGEVCVEEPRSHFEFRRCFIGELRKSNENYSFADWKNWDFTNLIFKPLMGRENTKKNKMAVIQ